MKRKNKVSKYTDEYNKLTFYFWIFWIRFSAEAKIIILSDMDLNVYAGNTKTIIIKTGGKWKGYYIR